MRLTGDEYTDQPISRMPGEEVLWRWARMDRQHLVLGQGHAYTGWTTGHMDYVRLVPLTPQQVRALDAPFGAKADRLVGAYFEPYSWAFSENVQMPLQHREPLAAFADARVGFVDSQLGRFGDKVVYESRLTDPLYHSTYGDPIGDVAEPTTDNVGRMQQFTNTLQAELRYARDLGVPVHANFGASACYVGTPLQGDITKQHPDWRRGDAMRFELPEVRAWVLGLYREALEIGAEAISIDYCRYPECLDSATTGNTFMRELRAIADEFGTRRRKRVRIFARFPATDVRLAAYFDYRTWARDGLVDYLGPSNLHGIQHHFDLAPYKAAVRGTRCVLTPVVDGLDWGLEMPGPFLWRVRQLYDAGLRGMYVYQADSRVLGRPEDRRTMRLLSNAEAVRAWWKREAAERPSCGKGIFIKGPCYAQGYHWWERLRVWTEGVPLGEMELYLDGKLVTHLQGPPYLLGTETHASDKVIPSGTHELRIRVRDGDGWLEQTFQIKGA
jgi:hypothetical protein